MPELVLDLRAVTVRRAGRTVLGPLDWRVEPGRHWVVLGPNGSGKSTLLAVVALMAHPSDGTVEVLGERLGSTDVRSLRTRLGYSAAGLANQLRGDLIAHDVVMTARRGALEPWWHDYDEDDRLAAHRALVRLGVDGVAEQAFTTLSSGERRRVLLARALVNEPAILTLDEPASALDLGGREELVAALDRLAAEPDGPTIVMVTHHVEEIPSSISDALLLRDGSVVASGPIEAALTAQSLSAAFGIDVHLERSEDRHGRRRFVARS